jgi:hypothetical protein
MTVPVVAETQPALPEEDEDPQFDVDPETGEIIEVKKAPVVVGKPVVVKPVSLKTFDPKKPMGHSMRRVNEESFM